MMQFPKLIQLSTPDMKVHKTFPAVMASTYPVCLQTSSTGFKQQDKLNDETPYLVAAT
jgi:hypothetical protein